MQSAVERESSQDGFTMVELIGVIAIAAILASMVSLNVVSHMKNAARQTEASNIETLRDALRDYILRTRQIPAATNWPAAIADEMGVPLSHVLQTRLGYARVFRDDPILEIGAATSVVRKLPYFQGMTGSVEPVSPRALLISTLGAPLPSLSQQSNVFNELWATTARSVPASWSAWKASGEDLWIERMDLGGLFHRVVLNNVDPDRAAPYGVNGAIGVRTIASGQRFEAWYLETTAMKLYLADGSLQAEEFVREDVSYIFENGRWNRYTNYGPRPPLAGFGLLAEEFRLSPVPPGNKFGASPQAVIDEVFTYLFTYGIWATGQPPDIPPFDPGGSNSERQVPSYRVTLDAQARLDSISYNLIN
jgi:prepilin-type N-terminal cleavage/methylation domain-containing protein